MSTEITERDIKGNGDYMNSQDPFLTIWQLCTSDYVKIGWRV